MPSYCEDALELIGHRKEELIEVIKKIAKEEFFDNKVCQYLINHADEFAEQLYNFNNSNLKSDLNLISLRNLLIQINGLFESCHHDHVKNEIRNKYVDAIKKIISIHSGQTDKIGEEYWKHPVRVMNKLPLGMAHPDCYLAALFHDVLEDTDYTIERLKNICGLSDITCNIIKNLTKEKQQPYKEYIHNLCFASLETIIIKICDMWDNLNITRMKQIDNDTRKRLLKKYLPAMDMLIEEVNKRINKDPMIKWHYPTFDVTLQEIKNLVDDYKYYRV